jgi:cysteine desulfurase
MMPSIVLAEYSKWVNQGNPSASYASAVTGRKLMMNFRQYIGKIVGAEVCCGEPRDNALVDTIPDKYKIIFTSGGSESNSTVVAGVIGTGRICGIAIPHIIMSTIEHKSLINAANSMVEKGIASITWVDPTPSGCINPVDIQRAIRCTTRLICVMHANNETGAINDVYAIGKLARSHGIWFHCDMVQSFGRNPPCVMGTIDSFSISFHKLHGPPGVGALGIRQGVLNRFSPIIYGTQNEGLRGGTENLPGIAAAALATSITLNNRLEKNKFIFEVKKYIIGQLATRYPSRGWISYQRDGCPGPTKGNPEIVFISGLNNYLANTILLSVISNPFSCNTKMKDALENMGIIVSVGSACNTSSPKASHVLYHIGADEYIRKGCLRISLGDDTTFEDADRFIKAFSKVIDMRLH